MEITLSGQHLLLLPQRAIFWRERSALILADMHFGKAAHFRKGGISIPEDLFIDDLKTLDGLILTHKPATMLIVGDMFHSHHNSEVDKFATWRSEKNNLDIHLIKGNHDILAATRYADMSIRVSETCCMDEFMFSHEPTGKETSFCFSGHIHPGVRIEGVARQSLRLPCFHFSKQQCVLPAFSKFTGLSLIKPAAGDKIYAIAGNEVIAFAV